MSQSCNSTDLTPAEEVEPKRDTLPSIVPIERPIERATCSERKLAALKKAREARKIKIALRKQEEEQNRLVMNEMKRDISEKDAKIEELNTLIIELNKREYSMKREKELDQLEYERRLRRTEERKRIRRRRSPSTSPDPPPQPTPTPQPPPKKKAKMRFIF
jgi:hypothetical protein